MTEECVDFSAKQEIISKITEEVGQLHPLLKSFLDKLESISDVEYTHGPSEKGADFVLTRIDPALGSHSYIGVVAKVGKIHQNLSEIERQIDECGQPRKLRGGRVEARLTEIWVITTDGITNNAKDKIHDKYSKNKVEFIDGEHLTRLVEQYAPWYWDQVPSAVGAYISKVVSKVSALDQELNVLASVDCDDFYVDPDIQEFAKVTYVNNRQPRKVNYVDLVDMVQRHKICLLEGDMGYGKSKCVRVLANRLCSPQYIKSDPLLPIFLTYRRFLEVYGGSIEKCIKAEIGSLLAEVEKGDYRVLLILDGVDEAATASDDWLEILKRSIEDAKQCRYLHVLLTSRPLRHIDEAVELAGNVKRLVLRALSLTKVVKFLELACQKLNLPKKLFEDLQRSDLFKQLPQSPIAAALLSSLLAQNQHDLPANMTELYSKALDLMLGRWDVKKKAASEKDFQVTERAALLLADYMVENRLLWMAETEARMMIDSWLSKRNMNVDREFVFAQLVDKSSIFARDDSTGTICFRHRSYGEYLFARHAAKTTGGVKAICSFDPYWIYPQFFMIGLQGDCPGVLEGLFAVKPDDEVQAWIKVLVMPDYLLAGYQTEYAIAENNLYKLFVEAAELYTRIRRGDTKTKLGNLPEMHLLWFFQRLIRYSFNYDYFRKAVEVTILKIDQELLEPEIKYVALFFASCYAAELGDGSGFEFMVKHYGAEKLPISVSLAIRYEHEINKDFSKLPLLKSHEKKLQTLLGLSSDTKSKDKRRDRITTQALLEDLFNKPIKSRTIN
jgi:hypothetical protein